jgi:predicted amidophosphoribosyltransferase
MLIETQEAGSGPGRIARVGRALRSAFDLTLGVALPQLCPACREPVEGSGLCASCWAQLSFIAPPFCERLGTPFAFDGGDGLLSLEAIADPPAYRRARAVVRYDDIAGRLVHALKYGDRLDLGPMMGRWMATAGKELLAETDLIVPVPLHWRRQWARRCNQSALFSRDHRQKNRTPGVTWRGQAREGHAATSWPRQDRARAECAGRIPRAPRRQGRNRRSQPLAHR